ncbi:2-C-methyl-D-erythritol 4-phosphate cytidylyltransferase [Adhaeribacter radiodurans]|uniref:2-C-methyl-D-erythritol 4-phosphate cytidylyltransferase n=1 Tax=Adhaeribacter radiodurans TaxID=2745197 RepID=A0A7L7LC35_9BACT|nr:2-C-methyl-D-erythritol 4-phosphate cytidylyltransferase [Adhaeribacter radiodurans]QMU30095.1 2-C-methyl-D-erythritol 4-phosphate cytidylyltransferase [Adhaeribacter radiodurans]
MLVNNQEYAILVAGGSGTRMQSQLPKQFLSIGGQPILMHTIQRFHLYNPHIKIVLVLPADQIFFWQQLCAEHAFTLPHQVVEGGASRFASVKNGLAVIMGEGVVAVHDGVRPFVPVSIIREAFTVAAEKGNAVVAVPLKESIRIVSEGSSRALDRNQYRLVQTPQCFQLSLLRQAYQLPEESSFTDDASVVERLGEKIYLVPGAYENVKITTPEDLLWAESFLQSGK